MEEKDGFARVIVTLIVTDPCLWCQERLDDGWAQRVMSPDTEGNMHEFGMHLQCWDEMLRAARRKNGAAKGSYPL
jgi:hypothetical protein